MRGGTDTLARPGHCAAAAPRPELPREPVPPRRGVHWKLALGVGAILSLIGGGSAAYVISNADKSDTTASPRTEASQRDSPAAAAPEQVSPQPSDDAVATTTTDVPTTTVGTTETRSTPPKETRATAPENAMRRHLQALVDQDYAAAFAEFSTGPDGSSEGDMAATARKYDASIAIGFIDEVSRDATGATVKVSFYTHDAGHAPGATGPDRCAWFHGTTHVVNQGGRWLYEPQSAGRTKLSKNFISRSDPRCTELLG